EKIVSKADEIDGFNYAGLVLTNRDAEGETIAGLKVVANMTNAAEYICREWVDEIFVYTSLFLETESDEDTPETSAEESGGIDLLLERCRQMAIPIHIWLPLSSFGGKSFIEKVGGFDVLTTTANYASPLQLALKRGLDIIGGIFGSIAALIVMTIVGPKIKKESPGPILFKQTRIGKNGRPFTFYKIRSMYMDAEEKKKELMQQNRVADGMMFKLDFDPRIIGNRIVDGKQVTGIGEFIRSTSLDEFPQFFNVLMGQMSLVGTRPPTVDEWEKYKYHHRARLAFKPGITGLWQVSGRSRITDFEEVVKLDTDYIQHWSIGLDLKILAKTVTAVFRKDGAM
ncbi:MAG: sugar transferase, partial [Methanobrevibacter sp.]|nr:sugar transferase [Methanobrevibacter sp.]